MDDDGEEKSESTESRLSFINVRLNEIVKRFDDVKWYITGLMGMVSVLVAAALLAASWNYNTERTNLEKFEQQIRDEIKQSGESKLGLLGPDGSDLSGQTIKIEDAHRDPEGIWHVLFSFKIQNYTKVQSGRLWWKYYTNIEIAKGVKSADEAKYEYESTFPDTRWGTLPGMIEVTTPFELVLHTTEFPKQRIPVLIKLYYGMGTVVSAAIYLIVDQSTSSPPATK